MSDFHLHFIPLDESYCPASERAEQGLAKLNAVTAINFHYRIYDTPQFIDSGADLEAILCPECGESLWEWWGEAMNRAYEQSFLALSVELPCCHADSSLNLLHYHFPSGFARFVISAENPKSYDAEDILQKLSEFYGTPFKTVSAHL